MRRLDTIVVMEAWFAKRCYIPPSEKDRATDTAVVVNMLYIRRLETIVVMEKTYAINVNMTSLITPVIKGLQMIWTVTDSATTVSRETLVDSTTEKEVNQKKEKPKDERESRKEEIPLVIYDIRTCSIWYKLVPKKIVEVFLLQ